MLGKCIFEDNKFLKLIIIPNKMGLRKLVSSEHPLIIFSGILYFSFMTLGVVKRCTYKPITEITEVYRIKESEQIEVWEDTGLRFYGGWGAGPKIYKARIKTKETYRQPYLTSYKKGEERPEIPKNAELIRKFERTHKTYFEWVNRHNPMINFLSTLKKGMEKTSSAR